MAIKTSIPKGTRDFSPDVVLQRNYIFDNLKKIFKLHGFQPIETPAMENLETLTGKYGEEGDKLIFKILNSGDILSNIQNQDLINISNNKLIQQISEKALRYDLTVPFARYIAQHQNEISFPFKRYQIQPVWRADRPQKGRYREFIQCDIDIIGSNSLLNEVELIQIIDEAFAALKIKYVIKINNRKVLTGIAEYINAPDKLIDITIAIDKIDKIGIDKTIEELKQKGVPQNSIDALIPIISNKEANNIKKLLLLKEKIINSVIGIQGLDELSEILNILEKLNSKANVEIDFSLARGLNYYTGAIFEVKALETEMGSIVGGGRYDNLTGLFGLDGVSGVGISFGADRIYDVMQELKIFDNLIDHTTQVLCMNFGIESIQDCIKTANILRQNNISAELYPDAAKIKKQFDYANKRNIPYVLIIGSEEVKLQKFSLKNMSTGEQQELTIDEIIKKIKDTK